MFSTLEEFYDDYCIKNGQVPNEVTLNRSVMRLKREVRELKSLVDMLMNKQLEPWNNSKFYEVDEYVSYNGKNYRSKVNGNTGFIPTNTEKWEEV